jgi:phosphopantetheinyl transferase
MNKDSKFVENHIKKKMISYKKYKVKDSDILHTKLIEDNKIESLIDQLNTNDINLFSLIKSSIRKKEFITTRILLNSYLNNKTSLYYQNSKPILNNSKHISISHKDHELIIGINDMIPIGVDIEKISDKILKIKSKFCNPKELLELKKNESIEILTMLWSAKEATFKCLENQENIYLKDISVSIVNNEQGFSEIKGERYSLDFKIHDGSYIICHSQKEN